MRLVNSIRKGVIEVGKQYTYKELCNLFQCTPRTGNSKKADMNQLKRYYEIEKVSHGVFEIISEYIHPISGTPSRGKHPNSRLNKPKRYAHYVDSLMRRFLSSGTIAAGYKRQLRAKTIAIKTNMCNENLIQLSNREDLAKHWLTKSCLKLIDDNIYMHVTDTVNRILNYQILKSLERFKKMGIIVYKKKRVFYHSGKALTQHENMKVEQIENRVLSELDKEKKEVVFGYGKRTFNSKCRSLCRKEFGDTIVKVYELRLISKEKLEDVDLIKDDSENLKYQIRKAVFDYIKNKNKRNEVMFESCEYNEIKPWNHSYSSHYVLNQVEYMLGVLFEDDAPSIIEDEACSYPFKQKIDRRISENEFGLKLIVTLYSVDLEEDTENEVPF